MKRAAPSSLAFLRNGRVHTTKSNSCLRSRWFVYEDEIPRPEIDPKYSEIGDFWECKVEDQLQEAGEEYVRERQIEREEAGVWIRGHIDFDLPEKDMIIECKALTTSNRRLTIIRKAKPDKAHVLQCCAYLIASGRQSALLKYAYVCYRSELDLQYTVPPHDKKGANTRDFKIEISSDGEILVDGKEWEEGTLWEMVQYIQEHQTRLEDRESLPERPMEDPIDPYSYPCRRCVYSPVCDKYDSHHLVGEDIDLGELVKEAAHLVTTTPPHEAKIFAPKIKKGKKQC